MKSLVIYATRTGNTRRVAEAIATELTLRGDVDVVPIAETRARPPDDVDLVVIGGPTEQHAATPDVVAFFDRLPANALSGLLAAAFDTRLSWPRWLSGSAATRIADSLHRAGARVVLPPESFIVSRKPALEPGELERAADWARELSATIEPEFEIVRPEAPAQLMEVES